MSFKIIGKILRIETIAAGSGVRKARHLQKKYGQGRWLKKKGTARILRWDGQLLWAELHWFEAHGIGKREVRVKRFL